MLPYRKESILLGKSQRLSTIFYEKSANEAELSQNNSFGPKQNFQSSFMTTKKEKEKMK
jgi:hypothetical protein